jgi:hypothetical protein
MTLLYKSVLYTDSPELMTPEQVEYLNYLRVSNYLTQENIDLAYAECNSFDEMLVAHHFSLYDPNATNTSEIIKYHTIESPIELYYYNDTLVNLKNFSKKEIIDLINKDLLVKRPNSEYIKFKFIQISDERLKVLFLFESTLTKAQTEMIEKYMNEYYNYAEKTYRNKDGSLDENSVKEFLSYHCYYGLDEDEPKAAFTNHRVKEFFNTFIFEPRQAYRLVENLMIEAINEKENN